MKLTTNTKFYINQHPEAEQIYLFDLDPLRMFTKKRGTFRSNGESRDIDQKSVLGSRDFGQMCGKNDKFFTLIVQGKT